MKEEKTFILNPFAWAKSLLDNNLIHVLRYDAILNTLSKTIVFSNKHQERSKIKWDYFG